MAKIISKREDEIYESKNRYFKEIDSLNKEVMITLSLTPSGEIRRIFLMENQSGNSKYVYEIINEIIKLKFRNLETNKIQFVDVRYK